MILNSHADKKNGVVAWESKSNKNVGASKKNKINKNLKRYTKMTLKCTNI